MKFAVGDIITVEESEYRIIGRITFMNQADNCYWDEYRMRSTSGQGEAWLSIDETFKEYSISWMTNISTEPYGFNLVDSGRAVVVSRMGDVDVDSGEYVNFFEYEDSTEEKIFSKEVWCDGPEYSQGYYLDEDEILFQRSEPHSIGNFSGGTVSKKVGGAIAVCIILAIVLVVGIPLVSLLAGVLFPTSIESHLNDSSGYTFETSITGSDQEQDKANVYSSGFANVDATAKDIIKAIDGKTSYVQQNTEDSDNSIAILTDNEYCLIYQSQDNEQILVQVSGRKYAYSTDNEIYHGTTHTRRYYRRFYRTLGYTSDTSRYSGTTSGYSSYSDSDISYDSGNSYHTYSNSIRQSSVRTRRSSGGGISSGK